VKVAIVDLGTNTCRLLLAEAGGAAVQTDVRETVVVRLGQGVDEAGRLHPDAVARTHACLAEYTPRLEAYGPVRRLLVATSVLRDAADGRAFLDDVVRRFALPTRVLGGEEEGALAFRGATTAATSVGPLAPPTLVVDIGGGSTEFIVGEPGRVPAFIRSLDIGVVRLTERFLADDPPTPHQLASLRERVAGAIDAGVPADVRAGVRSFVGVAGTFMTLAANKLGLREYRRELVDGHVLSLADIDAAVVHFAALTSAERGRLPGIQPGREDVILAGAMIAGAACRAFGRATVVCSESDLLEGAALALADGSLTASAAP
jgi:exopolyphosphatase/guanosine-5'-triphosphate,3'-diphosphate pyrophosphatase